MLPDSRQPGFPRCARRVQAGGVRRALKNRSDPVRTDSIASVVGPRKVVGASARGASRWVGTRNRSLAVVVPVVQRGSRSRRTPSVGSRAGPLSSLPFICVTPPDLKAGDGLVRHRQIRSRFLSRSFIVQSTVDVEGFLRKVRSPTITSSSFNWTVGYSTKQLSGSHRWSSTISVRRSLERGAEATRGY